MLLVMTPESSLNGNSGGGGIPDDASKWKLTSGTLYQTYDKGGKFTKVSGGEMAGGSTLELAVWHDDAGIPHGHLSGSASVKNATPDSANTLMLTVPALIDFDSTGLKPMNTVSSVKNTSVRGIYDLLTEVTEKTIPYSKLGLSGSDINITLYSLDGSYSYDATYARGFSWSFTVDTDLIPS